MDGNVIGINTAIYSPTGGSIGLGFAIPSSLAQPVVAELKDSGRVERGLLGVQIQPVSQGDRREPVAQGREAVPWWRWSSRTARRSRPVSSRVT